MRTTKLYLFPKNAGKSLGALWVVMLLITSVARGQLSITAKNTPFTIDFTTTVAGVNNGSFNPGANGGNITNNAPAVGQLDGNAWHFVNNGGTATGAATFPAGTQGGGRNVAFSTAPGGAANNATGQGWYGFNIGGSNRVLGVQPRNATFAYGGMITLRITNNTGSPINRLDVSYKVLERNNSAGANRVRFLHSGTNVAGSYTQINSLDVVTTDAEPAASLAVQGLNVASGNVVTITHNPGVNAGFNIGDVVFFNNAVANASGLRRVSGHITSIPNATTTVVEVDPAAGAVDGTYGAAGQFTIVPVITYNRGTTISATIPNGQSYFIRWFIDNPGSSGADELAIDDISIVADAEGMPITNTNISFVIDFDNTFTDVNVGAFTADTTFSVASPTAGRLNSSAWAFVNDGAGAPTDVASTFGLNATGGQGVSNGGVTTEGWYAFNVPIPNSVDTTITATSRALGWQSNTNFATDGSVTLRVTNMTGTTVQDFRISYTIWERNNTNVSNRVRVYISQTNNGAAGSYVLLPNSTHNSAGPTAGATTFTGFLYNLTARSAIAALSIPNGGSLYIRFHLDNNGVNAEGDEMAIDDISIIASAAPLNSINPNRNIVWAYEGFDYYESLQNVLDVDNDGTNDAASNFAAFKGIATQFGAFSTSIIPLHGISTNVNDDWLTGGANRFKSVNGYSALGWAGDWLSDPSPEDPGLFFGNVVVTPGQELNSSVAKPTIPITSNSQQRSLVNSGMYVEGGNGQSIGRRLQTSTAGYAFQYTATSTTNYTPCTTGGTGDCPSVSPIRHRNDVRVVTHIPVSANQGAGMQDRWTHTQNTRFGAQGSTIWVGVMLRKNRNDNDPVYISLHRNNTPFDITTDLNSQIQIGYFGEISGGFRHWGVRVNGVARHYNDAGFPFGSPQEINTRITTAQMINTGLAGQPSGGTLEERMFDLLVVRIDYSEGTPAAVANAAALATPVASYTNPHRIRMWVIRDLARDGNTPNGEVYPVSTNPNITSNAAFNPAGYPDGQGTNLDLLADDIPANDPAPDLNFTVPAAIDISFHSVAYFPGANADASAMDEFRVGGSFNQAALNSPIVSLIRGLCSANGGSLGVQSYQGGDFGNANCLDNNGNIVPGCPTTPSTATTGTQEVLQPGTDVWGSDVPNSTLYNTYNGTHPSYPNNGTANAVIRAGGNAQLFNGGPLNRNISGGQYGYQLNTGGSPNDNNYTIATQSRHSFGPAWIAFYDNSTRRDGYLMSINAAYARSKFFDQTISGLCADTQYEFSVDIINVLRTTRTITNTNPYSLVYDNEPTIQVATSICNPILEPGCAQFSIPGSTGSAIGLGAVTTGGTGANGHTTGTGTGGGASNRAFSLNPEIDFALNDSPIYTVPVSIPNDRKWHRVGLTFVTKANLSQSVNLSMRNLAPGGMGNDLAIDNISFRPCGSYSRLLDQSTICDPTPGTGGNVYVQIGKAGASYSNSKVRFQKWTPFASPISRLVTHVTSANPAVVTLVGANGTYGVPVGAEVQLLDLNSMSVNNSLAVVTSKTATQLTLGGLDASASPAYTPNTGVVKVLALTDPAITSISNTNPAVITLAAGVANDIELGTLVTFSGVGGTMSCINGLSGNVIDKTASTITVNVNATCGVYAASATERIALSQPNDDANGNLIAEESEWKDVDFNPYDGQDYSPTNVTPAGAVYQTPSMPGTPVAVSRDITENNVFYPNGTRFRAMFAGNEANLYDQSGRCRFIVPGFETNCSILPATGGQLRARKTNDGIQLIWSAFQERAGVKYILERSDDNKSFTPIADYPALNLEEYKHTDLAPFVGMNYYRVRIEESNRGVSYTNVASADWGTGNAVSIYPNPANDKVYVAFSKDFTNDQEVRVSLLNIMGVPMKDKTITAKTGEKVILIETQNIAEGLYLLEIKVGNEDRIVHKLVIKR